MASATVAFSGTEGNQFRATVDMTRSYIGTAAQNYETWTITGYVDRIATGITGYSRPDGYYDLEAGTYAPGEGSYGNVAINWANSVGRKFTTAISNMTIERFSDGSAYAATAEFYFFAGFNGVDTADALVGWTTNAAARAATITSATTTFYETENPTITFTTPVPSFPVDVLLQLNDIGTYTNVATRTGITSPYTIVLTNAERDAIRAALPNTSSVSFTYYLKTNDGSPFGVTTSYNGTAVNIDNRGGIASPTFTTFSVTDTTSALAVTSGGNPVMVQGKSIARATVTAANKAVAIKSATMSSYNFLVGSATQGFSYSSSSTVTGDIALSAVPTISGTQSMSVAAIDSRTNSTTASQNVLVLPYANPYFSPAIKIAYTNRFDTSGGMSVTLPGGTGLVNFSPLNTGGTDYNVINTSTGVQYQLHKNTINAGNPWNNIATTTVTGTGVQNVTASTLATSILSTMNGMGADNSVTWYVLFRVTDKYNTNLASSPFAIDIGAPIFRIGVDGYVYNNEKRILTTGDYVPSGWTTQVILPDQITNLGQHSYTVRYPGVDYSTTIGKGMRLLLNRNTATPTQCANLNGTNQYFTRASAGVNGMTFTDDYTASAWIYVASYNTANYITIVSRASSTAGWALDIAGSGQLRIYGWGSSAGKQAQSYVSVPLNRWVHVAGSMDLSGSVGTLYIDGIVVPSSLSNLGAGASALTQAGNLEIGSKNGGVELFNGKIAQVAIYSAVISQSAIQASMSQSLTGSETSLISAYTLSGSLTDLKGSNANTLTAQNGVTSPVDSPFALGADAVGTPGIAEYGIVTNVSYSSPNTTLTVQTPVGSAFPTTGSIASSYYSVQKAPFGFPTQKSKWRVLSVSRISEQVTIGAVNQWSASSSGRLTVPLGDWELSWQGEILQSSNVSGTRSFWATLFDATPANLSAGAVPTNLILTQRSYVNASSGTTITNAARVSNLVSLSAATVYQLYGAIDVATGTETWSVRGEQVPLLVTADLSYL